MTHDFWFKPKIHGYGAYPTSWKGWALIAVFGFAQLVLAFGLLLPADAMGQVLDLTKVAAFMLGTAAITSVFIWICKLKTDGEWKWRWPNREE